MDGYYHILLCKADPEQGTWIDSFLTVKVNAVLLGQDPETTAAYMALATRGQKEQIEEDARGVNMMMMRLKFDGALTGPYVLKSDDKLSRKEMEQFFASLEKRGELQAFLLKARKSNGKEENEEAENIEGE